MILGVIPARGGSKGLPRKNILPMLGMPLIYWSIQAAKKSKLIDDFVVSTDDLEIKQIAEGLGAKVVMRSAELGSDEATTISVLQSLHSQFNADHYVLLQPTSPLRRKDTVDLVIDRYLKSGKTNVATGYLTKISEYGSHNNLRRQDIKGFFYDDGNVYVLNSKLVAAGQWCGQDWLRYELNRPEQYEIDDLVDFKILENLMREELHLMQIHSDFHERLQDIKLVLTDVDGVLTDAGMYYSESGDELKKFNTLDGMGMAELRRKGYLVGFITGEDRELVKRRAQKLKVDFCFVGILNKLEVLEKILSQTQLSKKNVLYIGDDINDLEILGHVAVPVTVPHASSEIREKCIYVTKKPGGGGAFREVADLLLSCK
jgi:YrbI family 3-deoxy-D-manno-octulosonate 8-phosphate phosphatase